MRELVTLRLSLNPDLVEVILISDLRKYQLRLLGRAGLLVGVEPNAGERGYLTLISSYLEDAGIGFAVHLLEAVMSGLKNSWSNVNGTTEVYFNNVVQWFAVADAADHQAKHYDKTQMCDALPHKSLLC